MKKYLSILLLLMLVLSLLAGCRNDEVVPEDTSNSENSIVEMFTERDRETDYDASKAITIQLNKTTATASSDSVQIKGSTVTITEEAAYIISGSLTNGMLVVNAPDTAKLHLVLNGVDITSETSAALYILEADKVFITLADGTENTLANGGSFETTDDNNIDAALFAKQDLTLNGSGSLTVVSPAGHGIVCKDDLVFTSGTYAVNSAFHGLDVNDSVRIADADLTIDAGKDAIHCENTDDTSKGFIYLESGSINGEAEGDGITAGAYLQIEDGNIELLVGGGSENGTNFSSGNYGGFMGGKRGPIGSTTTTTEEDSTSMKGLKAAGNIVINGGCFTIDSADDNIHSDTSITVDGGTFELTSGDDAIHAEDTLTVNACTIMVNESYEGLEAEKIHIADGTITIHASDDGLNASGGNDSSGTTGGRDGMFGGGRDVMPGGRGGSSASNGNIEISGGQLTVYSSGDGLDSNGTLTISDGYIYVANPSSGDTSVIDSDSSPMITGGTFISTGASSMMAQSFSSSSTQGVIACTTGAQKVGAQVTVADEDGNTVISYEVEYPCVLVIISSPDIIKGETYTLTVGASSGEFEAN